MDAGFGAILLALGVLAIGLMREPSTAMIAIGLLACAPVATRIWSERRPRTFASGALVVVSYSLPWATVDELTVCAAIPMLFYYQTTFARCAVAGSALLMLAGYVPLTSSYVLLCAGYVTAVTTWIWLTHRQLIARRQAGRRSRFADLVRLGVQLALALLIGVGMAAGLPYLERWVVDRAADIVPRTSGFGNATNLSTVDTIQQSSRLVMRIYDPGPWLLRGKAYTQYNMGIWKQAFNETTPYAQDASHADAPVRAVSVTGGDRVLFVPMEWRALLAPGNEIQLDSSRVAHTRDNAVAWSFGVKKGRLGGTLAGEERTACLEVPEEVRAALAPLVAKAVRPGASPRQIAGDLLYALHGMCEYTLSPGATPPGREPLLRFLLETRKGHCEYFGTALALLCRIAGVPARYVGGYSAHERNPFGGFLMARDQDAHAWTEVFIDGEGWTTWDATPAQWRQELESTRSPWGQWFSQLGDWLQERWDAFYLMFTSMLLIPLAELFRGSSAGALVAALALLLSVAYWRRKLLARIATLLAFLAAFRGAAVAAGPEVTEAAAALERLEHLLAPLGVHRASSATPLELLKRVDDPTTRDAAADLIDLICRNRYGGAAWDAARAAAALEKLQREVTRKPGAH
jgi:hypothetical protein